jgi:hypothetical protein
MDELLFFLETYEIWVYVILSVVAFFYFQKLVAALGELKLAIFGLEREAAIRHLRNAMTVLILVILMGVSEFTLVSFVIPTYPSSGMLPTSTIDILITGTPTLSAPNPTDASDIEMAEPIATPAPEGCIPGLIEWTYPQPGEEINGTVELRGIINVPNLGFYKYEYSQPGSDNWLTIAAGNTVKNDDPLGGAWSTEQITPGDYRLRLVVADNQNQLFPACEIPIIILAQ